METRKELPFFKDPKSKFSLWKVLKDAIGKDLTRFCVPVYFNEPLSMLQKVAEIMDYEDLLVKANRSKDDLERLMHVGAFAIGQYACVPGRHSKPFNPLLGETFELLTPKFRYIAEQVSHHPPISACIASA